MRSRFLVKRVEFRVFFICLIVVLVFEVIVLFFSNSLEFFKVVFLSDFFYIVISVVKDSKVFILGI